MAARSGMAALITALRRMTDTAAPEWSDDALQAALDGTRQTHHNIALSGTPAWDNGVAVTLEYPIPGRWFEEDDGWRVHDGRGHDAPEHEVNFDAGVITFEADTGGATIYLDCRTYDLYAAAATIWEAKAAAAAQDVDWSTDNHSVSASQVAARYLEQARQYRAKAGGGMHVVELYRSDEAW